LAFDGSAQTLWRPHVLGGAFDSRDALRFSTGRRWSTDVPQALWAGDTVTDAFREKGLL